MRTIGNIIICKTDGDDYRASGFKTPESKIFIPDWIRNATERGVVRGRVLCAGPKCRNVAVGDHVVWHKSACHWETIEGQDLAFLHETDLWARIDDNATD